MMSNKCYVSECCESGASKFGVPKDAYGVW